MHIRTHGGCAKEEMHMWQCAVVHKDWTTCVVAQKVALQLHNWRSQSKAMHDIQIFCLVSGLLQQLQVMVSDIKCHLQTKHWHQKQWKQLGKFKLVKKTDCSTTAASFVEICHGNENNLCVCAKTILPTWNKRLGFCLTCMSNQHKRNQCNWLIRLLDDKRSVCLVKQISLLEIVSTAVLLAAVVVDLSRVFHVIDSSCTSSCSQVHTCSLWNTSCASNTLLRRHGSLGDSNLRTLC